MATGKYKEWITDEGLLKLEGWARDGLTDEQIAEKVGIRRQTIYDWKKNYPVISDALKKGKEVVDRAVEKSLLDRALGTTVKTITYKMVSVNEDVLKARRERFLNEYKLDHPDLSKNELTLIAVENVPTYERIPMVEVENHLPPDTTAQIFWLKNRRPDRWRDKRETELSGQMGVQSINPFKGLTEEELRKLAKEDSDTDG